ncbi:hypothetical protein MSG37_07720, partial [Shewanella sp. 1CM18E]|uniref:hypothetical protein n=1 Tax=Shewanella sp. 1CM18E TaxID=2929169 RepID=UPI0020C0D93F
MKKSLIAITVLSALSTSAMANECNTIIEGSLFECVDGDGQWAYLDKLGQNISFGDENDIVVDVYKNEDGTVTVQRQDENGDWNEVTLSEEEARASIKVIAKDRGIEAPIGVPNHGLNLKKGLDPRDKKGYNKLNERAQNSERVQEFHDIMESSGEYKGATGAERTAALESLLTDLQNDLSNMSKADQAKALAALNNITVSQKYDSVLDQVVNSWGLGTQEQKESFNEWNALSSEEKKILLAERVGYVKPIDAIIDPIIDEPQNGTEFKQKVDGLVGEGTVDKYVEAEDKTIAAADILATEGSEALMDIMIPNPSAGTSGEAKQISLYDYLDSVAKSDPDTFEPRMDSGEIVLRNAGLNLKEAGDNLVAQSKAAKVEVEKAIIATNEDIQRVETTLYKTHDAMELMNKKVEANTAA